MEFTALWTLQVLVEDVVHNLEGLLSEDGCMTETEKEKNKNLWAWIDQQGVEVG